jgi:hypothetical protein
MYAAIEDPNQPGDLYTSGSETYAQIQPPPLSVSVEINHQPPPPPPPSSSISPGIIAPVVASSTSTAAQIAKRLSTNSALLEDGISALTTTPVPPPLDTLRMHTRQESSSSCTSSVGNIGSPKPEKRQANSPLPPTPKVPAINIGVKNSGGDDKTDANSKKKPLSPSKGDLEGMYAKVMKKNKLFNLSSENSSPVAIRKSTNSVNTDPAKRNSTANHNNNNLDLFVSDPDVSKDISLTDFIAPISPGMGGVDNNYETIDKKRGRSNSYNRDPGYETIPGERNVIRRRDESGTDAASVNRVSGDYAQIMSKGRASAPPGGVAAAIQNVSRNSLNILHGMEKYGNTAATLVNEPGYESLPDRSFDPGYETLNSNRLGSRRDRNNSDYDPNYEELRPKDPTTSSSNSTTTTDVWGHRAPGDHTRKSTKSTDSNDGYSSIKPIETPSASKTEPGYSEIKEPSKKSTTTSPDQPNIQTVPLPIPTPTSSNISPSSFSNLSLDSNSSETQIDYTSISSSSTKTITNPRGTHYQSGSDTDPNYESVNYLNIQENPYERLHNEKNCSPDPSAEGVPSVVATTTIVSTDEEPLVSLISISSTISTSSPTQSASQPSSGAVTIMAKNKNNNDIEAGDAIYQV